MKARVSHTNIVSALLLCGSYSFLLAVLSPCLHSCAVLPHLADEEHYRTPLLPPRIDLYGHRAAITNSAKISSTAAVAEAQQDDYTRLASLYYKSRIQRVV
jgi:hypothetical protein